MKHTEIEERYKLIESIMQSGFDVAMGGSPFEPYDQEKAFEEARIDCDAKLQQLITSQLRAALERLKESGMSLYDDLETGQLIYVVPYSAIDEELSKLQKEGE
jgi:hypothetical protein